ncbi:uncharacterized protein [Pyrus communis]|uniref:uncharacterized protein n=1 Tax=Pyrus communis TaxID=23211 RepID=UPI0035C24689
MASQLPSTLALKSNSNNKYLRYIHEGDFQGFLQFSGDDVVSPYTKLHVEPASNGGNNGGLGLVNIRFAYNNKYLRRQDKDHWWIVAGADEPVEDKSLWSCTLWEPQVVVVDHNNNNKVLLRLRHVQLGHYARPLSANAFHSCLFASQKNPDTQTYEDVFSVTDWESLVIFPKLVAFKGDNDQFLTPKSIDGHPHLQFSASGLIDTSVGHEVFTAGDGSVRIKSTHTQNFWRRTSTKDWIWTATNDATNKDSDMLFWPVKLEAADHNNTDNINVVALRNLGNNNYSKRFTTGSKISCLCANVPTITVEAHLAVEEPVLSRKISDIGFRLTDARIYDKSEIVVATGIAENRTKEPTYAIIPLVYMDTRASTWNSIVDQVSFTSLIPTTITSATLFIVDEKDNVKLVGDQFTGVYEWGKARTSQTTIVTEFPVVVKPMTRVKVSLIATKGSCDVPFFYSQKDTLVSTEKKIVTYSKEGGVYTGVCFYNLKHKEEEEPL